VQGNQRRTPRFTVAARIGADAQVTQLVAALGASPPGLSWSLFGTFPVRLSWGHLNISVEIEADNRVYTESVITL
jgi:hypothetical protein